MRQINHSNTIFYSADISTGQVLTPAPGAKVVTVKDSHIIWQVYADMIWNFDLIIVWEEMKKYQLPWKLFTLKQCLINSLLALVLFFVSNFDVYSDVNLAHDYIAGATYMYMVTNFTYHPELDKLNCTVNVDTIQYNVFNGAYYGWFHLHSR